MNFIYRELLGKSWFSDVNTTRWFSYLYSYWFLHLPLSFAMPFEFHGDVIEGFRNLSEGAVVLPPKTKQSGKLNPKLVSVIGPWYIKLWLSSFYTITYTFYQQRNVSLLFKKILVALCSYAMMRARFTYIEKCGNRRWKMNSSLQMKCRFLKTSPHRKIKIWPNYSSLFDVWAKMFHWL